MLLVMPRRPAPRRAVTPRGVLAAALLLLPWPGAVVPASGASTADDGADASVVQPWPGSQSVRSVDVRGELGTDVSGLSYRMGRTRADDVLWGVDDRAGLIHRLVQRDGAWRPDTANGWSRGKSFAFPDGRRPDAEGLVVTNGAAWVSTERVFDGVSRNSILRVPLSGSSSTLGRTREWKLGAEFPAIGANAGLEALDFVPDSFLVAQGFRDEARGRTYDPAAYPRKVAGGVFLTAAEAASTGGKVKAFVLNDNGSFVRVATIANPLGLVRALEFDEHAGTLWIACDDDCDGRVAAARIRDGRFVVARVHARPTGLGNFNHEGFTVAPQARCSNGSRPVFWANDANNEGHAIRQGTLPCLTPTTTALATSRLVVRAPSGRTGTLRTVRVRVRSSAEGRALGTVTVEVAQRSRTGTVRRGRAAVRVGRFATPGRRLVTVLYSGDARREPATGRTRLRIRAR